MTTSSAATQRNTTTDVAMQPVLNAWADLLRLWKSDDQTPQAVAGMWSPLEAFAGAARASERGLQAYQHALDLNRKTADVLWHAAQRQHDMVIAGTHAVFSASSAVIGKHTVEVFRTMADTTSAAQQRVADAVLAMTAGRSQAASPERK